MTRIDLVDPPAYSPPYDHALASALAALGADVRLVTSPFVYGPVPEPDGYVREESFYRRAHGPAGSKVRTLSKLAAHGGDMRRYRHEARDLVHFQWLTVPRVDLRLLPERPTVLTIHDPLERGGRRGGINRSAFARVNAVIVHSQYARERVIEAHGLEPERVRVIRHGVLNPFSAGLTPLGDVKPAENGGSGKDGGSGGHDGSRALPPELPDTDRPVVLCFGLIRPYKGVETLLEAWRGITGAELWVVGRPMMDLGPLQQAVPDNVRFLTRFVTDQEEAAIFKRADLVVLPYERSERFGFSGVLATALGAGKAILLSDVGGFAEVGELNAARIVPAGDAAALHTALAELTTDPTARAQLEAGARKAAAEAYSWEAAAKATLALYETIAAE